MNNLNNHTTRELLIQNTLLTKEVESLRKQVDTLRKQLTNKTFIDSLISSSSSPLPARRHGRRTVQGRR